MKLIFSPKNDSFIHKAILTIVFLIISAFQTLQAQIEKKIYFERVNKKKGIIGPVLLGIFSREYHHQFGELYRIYGEDSLESKENSYNVWHLREDLVFQNIIGIHILNDSQLKVTGTYFLQKFDLDSNEMIKKFIVREIMNPNFSEPVRTIIKVHHTFSGRAFIEEWHHDAPIVLNNSEIVRIDIINKNRWMKSESLIRRKMISYQYLRYVVGTVGTFAILVGGIKLWVYIKSK